MTRKSPVPTLAGLATLSLLGSVQPAAVAHAAPTAQRPAAPVAPQAPAPAPTDPTLTGLDLATGTGTVTVDGKPMRVIASLAATQRPFTMAALTWTATTGSPVFQVRARTAAGWGAWRTLEVEHDGAEASASKARRQGTQPTWFDASTAVEARVLATGSATVTGPRLSLVDTRASSQDVGLMAKAEQVAAASASGNRVTAAAATGVTYATAPAVISRAQWGADEGLLSYNGSGCVPASIDTTINAAVVHNTAGSNTYTASQSAAIMRGIYAFHVKDRGWCDIGYNFLVDKYGQVFEGRHGGIDNPVHGAHATLWNTNTVGVSLMMDTNTAVQTPEAVDAITKVIAWKLAGNYRTPLTQLTMAGTTIDRITGHGDVMDTDCPGANLHAYLPTLRQKVAAAMGTWQTPIYQAWQAQGGEAGPLGSPHVLERPWNGGRTTTFTGGGIYQTPTGQTFWMGDATNQRYLASGAFAALGWPTASQASPSAGVTRTTFQKGTITWSSATGAHATTGLVDTWLAQHPADAARLGLPTGEYTGTATSGSQKFRNGMLVVDGTSVTAQYTTGLQGDLNGDGRADLLTVGAGNTITWYPTTASGAAGPARTGSTLGGTAITWVAQTPDVNGDGYTDLVARRSDGSLWSWFGQGQGNFTGGRQVGRGWNGMRQINVVPDMNRDGLPEIVAISPEQNLMRYQLGPQVTVVKTQQIGQRWGGIVHMTSVGDFRRVGVTDILGVTSDGRLWDYAGSATGSLSDGVQVGRGWVGFTQVRSLGDLDGDGYWDLAGNRPTGALQTYRSNPGWFDASRTLVTEVGGKGVLA